MMTEDEARTRWCPACGDRNLLHRMKENDAGAWFQKCIASECMAWRWDGVASKIAFDHQAKTGERTAPSGYCGLAGEPK